MTKGPYKCAPKYHCVCKWCGKEFMGKRSYSDCCEEDYCVYRHKQDIDRRAYEKRKKKQSESK